MKQKFALLLLIVLLVCVPPMYAFDGLISFTDIAQLIGQVQATKKFPAPLRSLSKDSAVHTRAALGSVIIGIAAVLKRDEVKTTVLPIVLQLLKDQASEVRLALIACLHPHSSSSSNSVSVSDLIPLDTLSAPLLQSITELAQDPKWRIRLEMIQHIPDIARHLGANFFDSKLSELSFKWLSDRVFSIREVRLLLDSHVFQLLISLFFRLQLKT